MDALADRTGDDRPARYLAVVALCCRRRSDPGFVSLSSRQYSSTWDGFETSCSHCRVRPVSTSSASEASQLQQLQAITRRSSVSRSNGVSDRAAAPRVDVVGRGGLRVFAIENLDSRSVVSRVVQNERFANRTEMRTRFRIVTVLPCRAALLLGVVDALFRLSTTAREYAVVAFQLDLVSHLRVRQCHEPAVVDDALDQRRFWVGTTSAFRVAVAFVLEVEGRHDDHLGFVAARAVAFRSIVYELLWDR